MTDNGSLSEGLQEMQGCIRKNERKHAGWKVNRLRVVNDAFLHAAYKKMHL